MDTSNLKASYKLRDSKPTTVGDIRRLIGFLNYYLKYIQNFSQIARPLFELLQKGPTQGRDIVKKRNFKDGGKGSVVIMSNTPVDW